jgi:ADP-heptose:LPS heptosyltransferase
VSAERALLYCAGGGIGDSLVASIVARALRARYAAVDALTLPGHRSTLERVPDLDAVLVDDDGDERELAARLAAGTYDACVVTWATPRTARVAQLSKIPLRVGQARRLYSFRFNKRVVVRSERGDVTSHWTDILLDYARAIGCDTQDRIPRFVPTAADEAEAERVLSERGLHRGDFIVLHPTNAIAPKRGLWPTRGWAALARALSERFAVPVVLTGTSNDAAINDAIAAESGATSLAGAVGIGGFGALAAASRAFVGITTGSMHVAAAVGAPTVGIFPFQTDFPERWAPAGARAAVVRASYPCHPGDTKETCPDYACIANLDVPRIVAALETLCGSVPPAAF